MATNFLGHLGRVLPLVTMVLAAACASAPVEPDSADPLLRPSTSAGENWERVRRTGFSFALPPGYTKIDAQPIDSDAATYTSDGASLLYDFGRYTAAPRIQGSRGVEEVVWIGGRRAEMVAFRRADGTNVVSAWWRAVSEGSAGTNHLLMSAEFSNESQRSSLLAAIYSVEFD